MRIISEQEFKNKIQDLLSNPNTHKCGWVTGPGRSGAIAAVYASHILHIPFIPFGSKAPPNLGPCLIIDTARESGRTLRKATRKYSEFNPVIVAVYEEPPRVAFWYEAPKPQSYKHEANRIDHDRTRIK